MTTTASLTLVCASLCLLHSITCLCAQIVRLNRRNSQLLCVLLQTSVAHLAQSMQITTADVLAKQIYLNIFAPEAAMPGTAMLTFTLSDST